ncbi:MAG: putative lipoprotein [Deltaproteobacteria bacterium]|nr:putative lipoprotein [Deltaproteobacteria bacterium]MBW2421302.1 putative lipoprotein [Deltaproteobacteria bacterium]
MTYARTTHAIVVTLLAFVLSAGVGCSFSKSISMSIKGISKSVSSPLRSSSDSSQSDATRYRDEVADYAQGFVISGGGDISGFQRGLAGIAEKHGISDWESDPETWKSLGVGLGRTQITDAALEGFAEGWAAGDSARSDLMRQGFESAR